MPGVEPLQFPQETLLVLESMQSMTQQVLGLEAGDNTLIAMALMSSGVLRSAL